jgi:hypothetical protein
MAYMDLGVCAGCVCEGVGALRILESRLPPPPNNPTQKKKKTDGGQFFQRNFFQNCVFTENWLLKRLSGRYWGFKGEKADHKAI